MSDFADQSSPSEVDLSIHSSSSKSDSADKEFESLAYKWVTRCVWVEPKPGKAAFMQEYFEKQLLPTLWNKQQRKKRPYRSIMILRPGQAFVSGDIISSVTSMSNMWCVFEVRQLMKFRDINPGFKHRLKKFLDALTTEHELWGVNEVTNFTIVDDIAIVYESVYKEVEFGDSCYFTPVEQAQAPKKDQQ